jgi:hypothetical protein
LPKLTRWRSQERDVSKRRDAPVDLQAERKRPRRENAVVKQERDIPRKSRSRLRESGTSMTFGFTEAETAGFPISRMCRVLEVSQSGFFAWQDRPACRRQQHDMVCLAHIRTAFALSNGTYGRSRMHRHLVDGGHETGRRRTARLMRGNRLIARQKLARSPAPGLVHHSDRGSQYCFVDCQALPRKRGILTSTSGRRGVTRTGGVHPLRLQDHRVGADLAGRLAIPPAGRKRRRKIYRRVP